MGAYYCSRVWQVKAGASPREVEHLASSGMVEMLRWMPGVKQVVLVQLTANEPSRYLLVLTFVNQAAYTYWRQVEEEAPDYWERFASIQLHWEQLCVLVEEYAGEILLNVELEQNGAQ